MGRPNKYNIRCKVCNKPLEWYRGRPKEYCSKCLLLIQRENGRKYYYENREKRLSYAKIYADSHKEEHKTYCQEYFKNPEKRAKRKQYMKSYYRRKKASKK